MHSKTSIAQEIFVSTIILVALVLAAVTSWYVFFFSTTAEELIERQSSEITKQIIFNYEHYVDGVIETANFLELTVINHDLASQIREVQDIFTLNSDIKRDVVSIILFDDKGQVVAGNPAIHDPGEVLQTPWFIQTRRQPELFNFQMLSTPNSLPIRRDTVISVSRWVRYRYDGSLRQGLLLIEFNTAVITDLAEKTNLGSRGFILIMDEGNNLVYQSDPMPEADFILSQAAGHFLGSFEQRVGDWYYYLNINSLYQTRWRIVTVLDVSDINETQRRAGMGAITIFMIALAFAALFAGYISYRISKPILQLKEIMSKIDGGNLATPVRVDGQRELVELSTSFSQMVIRVRELMEKLVWEQKEKRKTALRALQNQINPHFLYNTLDSIVWLAEHNRNRDVITTVIALARFFRISISRGETFISMADEVEHVENYLTIQQIRYVDRFKYLIQIDKDLYEYKIMKLILQPLVENAIYHGMGDEKEVISIQGRVEGKTMEISVTNSGYGLTDSKLQEIRRMFSGQEDQEGQSGVGLRNVYQRIKLYYGEPANLEISSVLDESVTVKLIIPLEIPGSGTDSGSSALGAGTTGSAPGSDSSTLGAGTEADQSTGSNNPHGIKQRSSTPGDQGDSL